MHCCWLLVYVSFFTCFLLSLRLPLEYLVNFEKHILSSWSVLRNDGCKQDVYLVGLTGPDPAWVLACSRLVLSISGTWGP